MKKIFFGLLVAVFALSSCSTLRRSTAVSMNIEAEINQYPTVTDLTLAQKPVTASMEWNWTPFAFMQQSLGERKENLIADILKKQGADVLVEPRYEFTKTTFGPRKLTITGYPATYKNFRPAGKEDLKAIHTAAHIRQLKKQVNSENFIDKLFKKKF